MYVRGREDCYYVAPWAWNGITRGMSKYIVIDHSKVSEKVDYFLDRESVYNHIRKIGFRRTPQDQVYVLSEAVREVNLKRNRNVANHDNSSGDDGKRIDKVGSMERRKHTNWESVVEEVVPKALTLRENIELVYPSFLAAQMSSDEYCCSSIQTTLDRPLVANTVISRDAEKEELSSIIKAALVKAEVISNLQNSSFNMLLYFNHYGIYVVFDRAAVSTCVEIPAPERL